MSIKEKQEAFKMSKHKEEPVFSKEEEKFIEPEMNDIMNQLRRISNNI